MCPILFHFPLILLDLPNGNKVFPERCVKQILKCLFKETLNVGRILKKGMH